MIFQDPYASLNPRMTVGNIISEPWTIHGMVPKKDRRNEDAGAARGRRASTRTTSTATRTSSPAVSASASASRGRSPSNPSIIIADEPVSALDVSVQAQVVNLLEDIQDEFGIAYLFIAHDLSVVRHICDRIAVMYLGKIVEEGDEYGVYDNTAHPYTQALLSAVPVPDPAGTSRSDVASCSKVTCRVPANPPSGCRFRTRCWKAQDVCAEEVPELVDRGQGHPWPATSRRSSSPKRFRARAATSTRPRSPTVDRRRCAGSGSSTV